MKVSNKVMENGCVIVKVVLNVKKKEKKKFFLYKGKQFVGKIIYF